MCDIYSNCLPPNRTHKRRHYGYLSLRGTGSAHDGKLVIACGNRRFPDTRTYTVEELPARDGRCFLLAKHDADGLEYDEFYEAFLHMNGAHHHCTCPGHRFYSLCVHVEVLRDLVNNTDALPHPQDRDAQLADHPTVPADDIPV